MKIFKQLEPGDEGQGEVEYHLEKQAESRELLPGEREAVTVAYRDPSARDSVVRSLVEGSESDRPDE